MWNQKQIFFKKNADCFIPRSANFDVLLTSRGRKMSCGNSQKRRTNIHMSEEKHTQSVHPASKRKQPGKEDIYIYMSEEKHTHKAFIQQARGNSQGRRTHIYIPHLHALTTHLHALHLCCFLSSLTSPLERYQYFRARGRGEETREIEGNSEMTKGTLFPGHCGGKKIFDINNKLKNRTKQSFILRKRRRSNNHLSLDTIEEDAGNSHVGSMRKQKKIFLVRDQKNASKSSTINS